MRRKLCSIVLACVFTPALMAQVNSIDAPRLFEEGMNAFTGVGPSHNPQIALEKLRRSGDLGYAPAQVVLGYIYEIGGGSITPQPSLALDWYKKAAKQDDKLGDWLLGRAYLTGVGMPRDLNLAAGPLRAAASQGDPFGEYLLGAVMLERNQYADAANWFRKAAMQGLSQAQLQLGLLLKDGQGVPPDKFEAYVWLLIAARAGNGAAGVHLEKLEAELGTNQVEQAKSKARDLEGSVNRVVVARGCTGWEGEFSVIPTPPPPDLQRFCR